MSTSALPELVEDASIVTDALPAERRSLAALVMRGALIVKPVRALRPLEELTVRFREPGIDDELTLSCTVVVLQPDRAVLALDVPSKLLVESARHGLTTVRPPTLRGSVLRFGTAFDLARAEAALCRHGFVMALQDGASLDATAVHIALLDEQDSTPLAARLMPHASGSIAIQLAEPSQAVPVVAALRAHALASLESRRAEPAAPVATAPVVTEPVVTEPVVEEPPFVDRAAPVVTEPVVTEPVVNGPVVEEPPFVDLAAPVVTEPVVNEPVVNEPVVEEPPFVDLAAPVVNAPVVTAPVVTEPVSSPITFSTDELDDVMPPPTTSSTLDEAPRPAAVMRDVAPSPVAPSPVAPSPVAPSPVAPSPDAQQAAVSQDTSKDAAPSAERAAAPADATVAPRLDGRILRLSRASDAQPLMDALSSVGALYVEGAHPTRAPDLRLQVAVGPLLDDREHDVLVMAGGPGHVVIQPQDRAALADALLRITQAGATSSTIAEPVGDGGGPRPDAASPANAPEDVRPAPTRDDDAKVDDVRNVDEKRDDARGDDAEAAPPYAPQPPRLSGGEIVFDDARDVAPQLEQVSAHGALMAAGTVMLGREPREVSLLVAGHAAGPIAANVSQMTDDTVVVMFASRDDARAALVRLVEEASARVDEGDVGVAPAASETAAPVGLKSAGRFKNPVRAEDVLKLSLVDQPTADELAEPSMPLLFRFLFSTGRSFRISIEVDQVIHKLAILGGQGARTMTPLSTVARALAHPSGSYVVEPLTDRVSYRVKSTPKELVTEVLRALIARLSYDETARALAAHEHECPIVPDDKLRLLDAIALTGTQLRLHKGFLDGKHPLSELLAAPSGARASYELIYLLSIFRALSWQKAPRGAASTGPKRSAAEVFLDENAKKTHFEVLGLHWSCSPKKIEPAYRSLVERYSPTGPLGKADPENAKRVRARLDEAFAVLEKSTSRQAYRRDALKLKWSQQAELMINHAKLAIYRGAFSEAQETIEGLLDFTSSPEIDALVRQLAKARNAKGGTDDD